MGWLRPSRGSDRLLGRWRGRMMRSTAPKAMPLRCLIAISGTVLALGCSSGGAAVDGTIEPLARVTSVDLPVEASEFEDGAAADRPENQVLEIAFDRERAEALWQNHVPEGLPAGNGDDLAVSAQFGDLDDVDFDRQVVVLWWASQSGGCGEELTRTNVADGGTVELDVAVEGGGCADLRNTYHQVAAVSRSAVPEPQDLPTADVTGMDRPEPAVGPLVEVREFASGRSAGG